MTESDMQPGEIQRALVRIDTSLQALASEVRARHHELSNEMTVQLGPIAIHGVQITALEAAQKTLTSDIKDLGNDVEKVTASANKIAGAGALLAVAGAWLVSWFKH